MFKCANVCYALKSVSSSFLLVPKVVIWPILDGLDKGVYEEATTMITCGMIFGGTWIGFCCTKKHEEWRFRLESSMLLSLKMFVAIMS